MTKPEYTHISLVLDRSGSMEDCKQATIGGVNEFIKGQKAVPGTATFSLSQFDDQYDVIHSAAPLQSVPDLTDATYVPRGSTALYDAVARCIRETGDYLSKLTEAQRPAKVIFAIVTDGMENASTKTRAADLNAMIRHQTDTYGWIFTYIGANQDAIMSAASIGIYSNAINYSGTTRGTAAAFSAVNKATAGVRMGGVSGQSMYSGAKSIDEIEPA